MRALVILFVIGSSPSLASGQAQEQEQPAIVLEKPAPRQNYYISIGAGGSRIATLLDEKNLVPAQGFGWNFRFGQAVNSQFDLGLGISGSAASGGPRTQSTFGLQMELQWHPVEPLTLRTGFGIGAISILDDRDPEENLEGVFGDAWQLGVGYEFYPFHDDPLDSGAFGLNLMAVARIVPGRDDRYIETWVGLEFTWWTGLPDSQLELPFDAQFKKDD